MVRLDIKIWELLNDVRGFVDISETKELLISLVFLKHANNQYYSKIIIPKRATWEFLYSKINTPNFFNCLLEGFNALENENSELRGTFSLFNFRLKEEKDSEFISVLFQKVSDFPLLEDNINFSNFIGDLLIKFSEFEGRSSTDLSTPLNVSNLMVEILNPNEGSVLDSACGSGGFFEKIEDNYPNEEFQFYGQEYNGATLALAKLRFAFDGKSTIEFGEEKSTLSDDQFSELKVDYVIMHPPFKSFANEINNFDPRFQFGLPPKSNANYAWIQHAIYHLKPRGKAVLLLGQNTLFTNQKDEVLIRKNIIENNLLEAIIALPAGIINYTGIKTCIWVLNKEKKTKDVLLLESDVLSEKDLKNTNFSIKGIEKITQIYNDFSEVEDVSRIVSLEELRENDYSLQPSRYFNLFIDEELSNPVSLSDLLKAAKTKRGLLSFPVKTLSIKDLSNDIDNFEIKISELEERENIKNYVLFKGRALLLASLGTKLKPSFIDTLNEEIAIQQNVVIYNINENKVIIDFLIQELNKGYVEKQFNRFLRGAAIKHINKKDILSLILDVPELPSQQSEIVKREKQIRFEKLVLKSGYQKLLEGFKKGQEADLSSKRHMLNQDVSSLNSIVEYVKGEFNFRKEGIKLDTVLDSRDGTTMQSLLNSLTETVRVISNQVNLLSNNVDELNKEVLDIKTFLKQLVKRESSKSFRIVESYDDDDFNTKIFADKRQFRDVFKSVLNNAVRHGFMDSKSNNVFKITLKDNGEFIDLIMENNGAPLPKGVTKQSYSTKSMKAGKTGNTGLGGYHVGVFTKSHDLKWDLINSKEDEFKVGIKLKLEKYESI